jgi:uncharacterized protein YigA (DUF484 family)
MQLDPDEVARYLQENPDFFDRYAAQLADIALPHPRGGHAIPLAGRQVIALRDKNRALEEKLRELVHFGQENDAIIDRLHRITLAMMMARDLDALLASLYYNLREDFAVPHVAVRLWAAADPTRPEFAAASEEARVFAESLTNPYCAAHAMFETAAWFGPDAHGLHSFAYAPLRMEKAFGLLALAAEDPERFHPGMETLYLKRLGELISVALSRFVKLA